MEYSVGFCQYKPILMDVDSNLGKLNKMLDGVEADLIVLPELALSGYVFKDKKELEAVSEDPNDGKTVIFFKKLSLKNNTSYVVGFPEKGTDKQGNPVIYNSCFLVNPDGSYFVYRKIHLFNREKLLFTPGDGGFEVVPAKYGIKIGMMVCFDWIFPESARTLAMKGAQIICHPANLVLPWCQQAMITRSVENRVFIITSNRIGNEVNGELVMTFTGQSQLTSPKGEIINRLDTVQEGTWVASINPHDAQEKMVTEYNHIFNDRRPEYYEI